MSSMNFAYDVCGREVLSCTFANGMKFTCDVCGREVFTCIFVNGMKFCAKCYQETFGETDKDRKIADLEAKLAESEKKAYSRGHSQRDIANEIKLNALREDVANKEKRIVELKQQLAEKEKENLTLFSMLYETLEKQGCENIVSTIEQMTNLTLEKQSNWFKGNCVKDQDKISFTIQQLEKARKLIDELLDNYGDKQYKVWEVFDNQIRQLKEKK